jgi:hypothetical protein
MTLRTAVTGHNNKTEKFKQAERIPFKNPRRKLVATSNSVDQVQEAPIKISTPCRHIRHQTLHTPSQKNQRDNQTI